MTLKIFQDKIYLGIANGSVDVRDSRNIEFLRTINHTPSVQEPTEFMRLVFIFQCLKLSEFPVIKTANF